MELMSGVLGVAAGVAVARASARLREHRREPAGLADLLGWGFLVADGVVLQKDGSLLAGFEYAGPDVTAATPAELNALSRHINDALVPFADDWMLHVDAIRQPAAPYAASVFPDPVTQLIDEERRSGYQKQASRQFESAYTLVATHLPAPEIFTRLSAWFVQRGVASASTMPDWDRLLAGYSAALQDLEHRLSSRLRLGRLDSDSLMRHLHTCLTGDPHPVRAPEHGSYLNSVLADQELLGGFEPRIGAKHIRVVAVHGYPHASHAAALDLLNSLPYAFRWSNRVLPLGQQAAARLIRRHQLTWYKKRKGAAAWVQDMAGAGGASRARNTGSSADADLFLDHDARRMAQDAGEAAAENASGGVRFCFYNQVVVVTDHDSRRADAVAAEIVKTLHDSGYTGRVESVNALEAFLGTLPGHGYPNLRRPVMSTRNVADLLPVTSVWPGLAVNPSPLFPPGSPPLLWTATGGATPFRVNLHDSDVGHAIVLGKTGSGKSTLLGILAAQFRRYPRAQVFVFDVGYSMWVLARAVGGAHYDLAAGRADVLRFQPLARVDEPSERAWAAEWLETLATLQGVTVTPAHRSRIERALALVAENAPPHRTLTELLTQLQHAELLAALRPYTLAGLYGQLLDAAQDDLGESDFTVFELRHLLALDDRIAIPVLLYLFHRIEQRLDGRPTLIEIDEAWVALLHPKFGPRVTQWLLTLRKQNGAVVLATQSPAQLAQFASRHAVVESCPTKFYLPNADAVSPSAASLYRDLGLNDREIATVAAATPKRHYYVKSPRGSRLFDLSLGPVALAFLNAPAGQTVEESKRQIEALIEQHQVTWPAEWLARQGLSDWSETLDKALGWANRAADSVATTVL
jgi:type IV secretion/conjugal transfer VirB4 family ATPase